MSSIEERDGVIIFGHLTEADSRVGDTCKFETDIVPAEAFHQTNAKGNLKVVSGHRDVAELAYNTAKLRRNAFI